MDSVKQPFGSPGGKTRLAEKIVDVMPEHKIYVEPFAGGAAVYFKKGASDKDVLNDKDASIAFAFRFLRDMTPEQFNKLKSYNWVANEKTFAKLKNLQPKDDVERFYKFYYMRWCSFGAGSVSMSPLRKGQEKDISRLTKVSDRLKNTTVHNTTAVKLIKKYDSKDTLFYLDPPYPNRAFIGSTFGVYTNDDLKELLNAVKDIKGKVIVSLGTEHTSYLPSGWYLRRLKLRRNIPKEGQEWNKAFEYEIIMTNYDTGNGIKRHSYKRLRRKDKHKNTKRKATEIIKRR